MKNKNLLICFALCLVSLNLFAQDKTTDSVKIKPKLKKFYIGTGMDGGIFSTATIKQTTTQQLAGIPVTTTANSMGTVRFSYVINLGLTFNFNLSRHFGLYTGVDIKNIGYIDHENGFTVKRRTYNIGAPIGIKVGNMMPKRTYAFFGGGADVPINYRQKSFQVRTEKTKFNEWFSDRTPVVMPYVFVGMALPHGLSIKAQYYPDNFLNPNFTQNGEAPYAGTEVHLVLLSIGFAVPVSDHHDMVKKHVADLQAK